MVSEDQTADVDRDDVSPFLRQPDRVCAALQTAAICHRHDPFHQTFSDGNVLGT
jgi:hypothetical protein